MNNFSNQNQNNQQQANFNQQSNQQQSNNQTQQNQQSNNQNPGLMQTLLNATLPALLQHFTGGQQMPTGGNNSSNSPEIQLILSQVLMLSQQILASQQDLTKRIFNLEISASQQLTSISQQLQSAKSVRLSHSKETKSVDYNLQQENDPNNKY